ncbi:MAG: rhamnulokinase [Chloroflexi bacterium]|nr:rhamnulokinase [Chloroflexota bacterium]
MARKTVLAVDLGAESGRVMAVHFDGARLDLEELHRFTNPVTTVRGTMHWDILHLWRNIQQGIEHGKKHQPVSVGVDTWAIDFGLLDGRGSLIANPVCYRDSRTNGMMETAFAKVPQREIFEQTGIQFMPINTLYQLLSLVEAKSPLLDVAQTFLTIPDLLNFWLTGVQVGEFTNATTTQMLNPRTGQWASDMLSRLGIPTRILPEIVPPGTKLGTYDGIPVIAPATHDTGSAVAAVPTQNAHYAYISSGTWSLVGLEIGQAVITDEAFAANVTNEGGVAGTYRLLKNVMGLWIVQQCRATWLAQGREYSYAELVGLAKQAAPLRSIVDVDDGRFLAPGDHPQHIRDWCAEHHQPVPDSIGAVVRCVLESLALKYRAIIERLQAIARQTVEVIHIVGGGTQNELLNQFTADATGIPVVTGPIEATVLGNAVVQLMAQGEIGSLQEARQLLATMGLTKLYTPQNTGDWQRFAYKN